MTGCAGTAAQPETGPRPVATSRTVPSVVGTSVGKAVVTLVRSGYGVRLVEIGDGQSAVSVLSQEPTGGAMSDAATVTVTVDAWTESADVPNPQDAAPNKGVAFYALVVMSSTSKQAAFAGLGVAQRYSQAPFVALIVDESDHYAGLPSGQFVVIGAFENKVIATRQAENLAGLGFDAHVQQVTKTCTDPIEINRDSPDI